MNFKIGTRKSLLARTQCNQTKKTLESLSDNKFDLVFFTTEGDQKTDKALWQLEGKDFFTKELDNALLANDVDINVHSYKDLGSERPKNITLAAIPKRQIPNDILFINKKTIEKLQNKSISKFIIGTSSPRREVNLKSSIKEYLPFGSILDIETKILRGNVNTRIEKLVNGNYDAIVLAFAGIERLAITTESREILSTLLKDTNFMILPQTIFPPAASQGALAIEKNSSIKNDQLNKVLDDIHDENTFNEVKVERKLFNKYGGGCHLAVGIFVKNVNKGTIIIQKGETESQKIDSIEYITENMPKKTNNQILFYGGNINSEASNTKDVLTDKIIKKVSLNKKYELNNENLLVTSKHCIDSLDKVQNCNIFSGGTNSWKALANEGYWVNACGAIEGEKELSSYLESNLLQLYLTNSNFSVLTNDVAKSTFGKTLPCYTREEVDVENTFEEQIKNCDVFYWTSFYQYTKYLALFPYISNKTHCCGLGKTYSQFKDKKIKVFPFLNLQSYIKYFKN